MNKLIEKIEAEIDRCDDASYNTMYIDGLRCAVDILSSTPILCLEEITEEEAKKETAGARNEVLCFTGTYYATIHWSALHCKWIGEVMPDDIPKCKFYRLPQAKEEKWAAINDRAGVQE